MTSRSQRVFISFFVVYTAGAIALLTVGTASALASLNPPLRDLFETWGNGTGLLNVIWLAIVRASTLTESPWALVPDYALTLLNLGFGIFIVWRRPWDWVARLLGLAMVGTAMAFNLQAHSVLAALSQPGFVPTQLSLRPLTAFHFVYHAISGATYVHALLLFPNGKLVPRRSIWIVGCLYFLVIEESVMALSKAIFGLTIFASRAIVTAPLGSIERIFQLLVSVRSGGLLLAIFDNQFRIEQSVTNFNSLIEAESTFFVLLFGLLIPIIGIISQVYRYRAVSSTQEREQTKFVVWAMALSFSMGLVFLLLVIAQTAASQTGATFALLQNIEDSAGWIFPLMFSVIPIALFLGILRYRLFDIDLVIQRTLVYGPLTAILAGVFALLSNVFQRVFLTLTGSTSEFATGLAALIAAVAFMPIRSRIQSIVDKRFKGESKSAAPMTLLRAEGDLERARNLLDTLARAFDAESGAIYLGNAEPLQLLCTCGEWKEIAKISVPLVASGVRLGVVALGARHGGLDYSAQDQESIAHTASVLARAIGASQT